MPSPPPAYVPSGEERPGAAAPDTRRYASDAYTIGEDTDSYDDNDPAALTDFRPALDPYGAWADDPTYGTVWVPSAAAVGPDFQPYVSSGHWTYDDDYVWVSDYSWGWAPFHYGRWVMIEGRGWSWIPGRAYRGAWVNWSVDDGFGYVGWSPAPPLWIWFGGAAVGWNGYWGPRWSYCPRAAVFAPRVGASVVVGPAAVAIAPRMHPYGGIGARVVAGPPPSRLGYAPSQIPRASGPAAGSVARARDFARPSTAQPLGAHGATAVAASRGFADTRGAPVAVTQGGMRPVPTQSARPALVPGGVRRAMPTVAPRPMPVAAPRASPGGNGGTPRPSAMPVFRPSGGGAVHGGGIHR